MAQVHATLGNASLLKTFFERLEQICILIESLAHNANTELARDMIATSRLNVLLYGRSGSGKSTLIGTLTNNTEDGQGSTNLHSIGEGAVTTTVTNYATACGIHFTDRPGIDIPGAQAQNAEGTASVEQMAATSSLLKRGSDFLAEQARRVEWARQLRDLDRRLRSSSAEDRPLALVYVHHAAHRLYPDRVKELIRRSHDMLVPTFVVLSDKWSVGKHELATKEAEVAELLAQVGPNKRGKMILQLSLSSKPKPVGATIHPIAGIPEFVSTLLSTLDPADALTFLKHEGLLTKVLGKRRRTEAEPEAEAE
jgi:GTP-binding protein EngB required for normal cell division